MKTTPKQIGIILLASCFFALISNSVHPRKIAWVHDWSNHVEAKAKKQSIEVIPLSIALEKFTAKHSVFVDARPFSEFEEGHIPFAVSLPFETLDDHFEVLSELLELGGELVVYCKNRECDDSLMLASELQAMGCSNIVLFVDGFEVWAANGGAVE